MESKELRRLGVIMVIAAAVLFTMERVGSIIARSREYVILIEQHWTGRGADTPLPGFWDNGFVPVLTIAGAILFLFSFLKGQR